jgi:DNA-binding NtrC family response regulator
MDGPLILYVDDERANRVVFEQSFCRQFNIRCATGGEEAVAILSEGQVAVLLTDQRMPGMSGHRLLEYARERYPDVIRVVVTAYGDLDRILRAVNEGLVARYLVKPWDHAELEQILMWCLKAHSLARQGSTLQLQLMQFERLVTIGANRAAVLHDLQHSIACMRLNIDRLNQHVALIREALPSVPSGPSVCDLQSAVTELPPLIVDLELAADVMLGIVQHLRSSLQPDTAPAA